MIIHINLRFSLYLYNLQNSLNNQGKLHSMSIIRIQKQPTTEPKPQSKPAEPLQLVDGASCFSKLFFRWSFELIKKGQQEKQIQINEMPTLTQEQLIQKKHQTFNQFWIKQKVQAKPSLYRVIYESQKPEIIIILLLSIVEYSLYLAFPILIYYDIDYVQNGQYTTWQSTVMFLLTTVGLLLLNITLAHQRYQVNCFGTNLVNTINMMIFDKSLRFPILSTKKYTEGDIINYSQIDADNLREVGHRLVFFIFGVIQIIAELTILYFFIGLLFLIPLGVMILVNFISYWIGKVTIELNDQVLSKKDERSNVTNETLNKIKHIKINTFQKCFFGKIKKVRQEELLAMKNKGFLQSFLVLIYNLAVPCIISAVFITMHLLGDQITAPKIFIIMSVARIFEFTSHMLPRSIAQIISVFNSVKRIQTFLLSEEIKKKNYEVNVDNDEEPILGNNSSIQNKDGTEQNQQQTTPTFAVQIQRGNFYYGQNSDQKQQIKETDGQMIVGTDVSLKLPAQNKNKMHVLKNINLNFEKGKLYMIYGKIGSGKSTLLLSILNEMNKDPETIVKVNGKIAYVSQRPWVMCQTLENNVMFTQEKSWKRLKETFNHSYLSQDIKLLPQKHGTAIGQNGINLSGGQRTRVSLARSLYSENDIYLFDDILSAVDVHVADKIMTKTIKQRLKDKTIILVTHAEKYAKYADKIIFMQEGQISYEGQYNQYIKNKISGDVTKEPELIRRKSNKCIESAERTHERQQNFMQYLLKKQSSSMVRKQSLKDQSITNSIISKEEVDIGEVKMQIFKNYIMLNGGYCWFFTIILGSFAAYAGFLIVSAIFVQQWSASDGTDSKSLYLYVGFSISAVLFVFIQTYALVISSINQGKQVHQCIIRRLLYASYTDFFNKVPKGRILNSLGKDIKQLDEAVGLSLGSCLLFLMQFLSGVTLMVYCSSLYMLIPIGAIFIVFYLIRKYYVASFYQVVRLQKITNSPVVSGFTTAISGLPKIRAYRKQKQFFEMQANRLNQNNRVVLNRYGMQSWFQLTMNCLIFIVNAACIGYAMFSKSATSSSFGLLLISMIVVNEQIYELFKEYTTLEANMICLQRLYHYMELQMEPAYLPHLQRLAQSSGSNSKAKDEKKVIKHGRIEFQNACIKYRQDLPNIITNLNVIIEPGQWVGIVGGSGSGKSTIFNSLLRITEASQGKIIIDETEIKDIFVRDLRGEITVIDQEPVIIQSTFRQNIDPQNIKTDEQLVQILTRCQLYNMVRKKGGLQAKIQKNNLSSGEKQLLCICRAFLKDSKIILVDEATSNVDAQSDKQIQQQIRSKFKGRTMLTIAHRLKTVQNYDKIMVMDKGSLAEMGSHQELMEKKGKYYNMYQIEEREDKQRQ